MMDLEDRDIKRVRLRLVDLVKSFFIEEPDAEKMSRWRGTFSALSKERVNPAFDKGVMDILQFLEQKSLEELQQEYYKLFIDPFTDKGLNTSVSFYLDGRNHGKTLVELRSFLNELGIAKNKDVSDTEDSLPVLLDILTRLIEQENGTEDNTPQRYERELLQKYLAPLAVKLSEACEKNDFADFYKACIGFFCGYLELEKGLTESVVSP